MTRLYEPVDRAAAEQLVDLALTGASETYRANHRDSMIRNEAVFQRFMREQREYLEHKAGASLEEAA